MNKNIKKQEWNTLTGEGIGHFLSVVGFKCIKIGMWVEIFIPWHKIFASGATKNHFKQETYHPKLWLKQKEVWRHHFSAFPQSSTLLTLLSHVEASNSKKKNLPKNRLSGTDMFFFSIHKTANSPTENASQCRSLNPSTSSPAKAHHTVQKSSPTYQLHFRQQLHRCFWQVSEWIWCWNTTHISFNDF